MRRALATIALTSALAVSGSCAPPTQPLHELRLTDQAFVFDTWLEVDRLIVSAGASVRVGPQAFVWIRTNELVVEGDAVIDGRGTPGTDRPDWTSSGNCNGGFISPGHIDWENSRINSVTDVGGPGGAGSVLEIRYQTEAASSAGLSHVDLPFLGGSGGHGTALRCACHPDEVKMGPSGPDGRPGSASWIHE